MKTSNERWRQPTVIRYEYNDYMAHHYVYMAKVAEVRDPESYVEVAKDTKACRYGGRDARIGGEQNMRPG